MAEAVTKVNENQQHQRVILRRPITIIIIDIIETVRHIRTLGSQKTLPIFVSFLLISIPLYRSLSLSTSQVVRIHIHPFFLNNNFLIIKKQSKFSLHIFSLSLSFLIYIVIEYIQILTIIIKIKNLF